MISETYFIDCMIHMKGCRDNTYGLGICDPWYGLRMNQQLTGFAKKRFNSWIPENDNPPGPYYFKEVQRVCKEVIIWGGNYFLDYLGKCVAPRIWHKKTGRNYFADGEMAWTSFKKGAMRIFSHQWCGAFKDSERGEKILHSCQKPVALYYWLLKLDAKPGQIIFDPGVGSGSLRIACWDLGFDFVGCEIEKIPFDFQEDRFQRHLIKQGRERVSYNEIWELES